MTGARFGDTSIHLAFKVRVHLQFMITSIQFLRAAIYLIGSIAVFASSAWAYVASRPILADGQTLQVPQSFVERAGKVDAGKAIPPIEPPTNREIEKIWEKQFQRSLIDPPKPERQTATRPKIVPRRPPAPILDLDLVGLIKDQDEIHCRAWLRHRGKRTMVSVGDVMDKVPYSPKIISINTSSVLVEYAGVQKSLSWEEPSSWRSSSGILQLPNQSIK